MKFNVSVEEYANILKSEKSHERFATKMSEMGFDLKRRTTMKTINDLVDVLNRKCTLGEFIYGKDNQEITLYKKVDGDLTRLITFYEDEDYPAWILRDFRAIAPRNQKTIMDFVYNTDRKEWFKLPDRFNIIMGYDMPHITCAAYCWADIGDRETIFPTSEVYMDELDKDDFLFTEDDIEYIKSDLCYPQTLMIDLGVMEGKRRAKGEHNEDNL